MKFVVVIAFYSILFIAVAYNGNAQNNSCVLRVRVLREKDKKPCKKVVTNLCLNGNDDVIIARSKTDRHGIFTYKNLDTMNTYEVMIKNKNPRLMHYILTNVKCGKIKVDSMYDWEILGAHAKIRSIRCGFGACHVE